MASTLLPLLLVLAFLACDSSEPKPTPILPTREITVSSGETSAKLTVELAITGKQREQGLMLRQKMDESQGMLFFFRNDQTIGFWMKDTYLPLSIAYLDESGTILEIRDAKPLDQTILTPAKPYRNTLEVNQGWFERRKLGVGSKVALPDNPGTIE
jgi:uncharacterized membrane protein (UPF0127 family)